MKNKFKSFLHPQILAANIISLMLLIYGCCNGIYSTLLYSFEKGSEGISMPLEDASWACKSLLLKQKFTVISGNVLLQ